MPKDASILLAGVSEKWNFLPIQQLHKLLPVGLWDRDLYFAEPDEVASPTYTLIHEYGGGRAYHIDLYRLDKAEQVATLGLDDIFDREAVVLIEWGERFPELIPTPRMEIRLTAVGELERKIETKTVL